MRTAWALCLLLLGAGTAEAAEPAKYCSQGFDKAAELTPRPGDVDGWQIVMNGKVVKTFDIEDEALHSADLSVWVEGEEGPKQHVWIFQDRVFWPCEK